MESFASHWNAWMRKLRCARHLSFGCHLLCAISATHVIRLSFALRASFASCH